MSDVRAPVELLGAGIVKSVAGQALTVFSTASLFDRRSEGYP